MTEDLFSKNYLGHNLVLQEHHNDTYTCTSCGLIIIKGYRSKRWLILESGYKPNKPLIISCNEMQIKKLLE